MSVNPRVDTPIFVLGCHKSGTSLVRSLLDGHPELVSIPFETHLFEHLGWPILYPLRPRPYRDVTWTACFNQLLETLRNAGDSRLGGSTTTSIDFEAFHKTIQAALQDSETAPSPHSLSGLYRLFRTVALATASSQKGSPFSARIVEKSVDHMEFSWPLATAFPQAHFIHIVRDPLDNLVTLRHHISGPSFPTLRPLVAAIRMSLTLAHRNSLTTSNYTVIRYEDLTFQPEETMRNVARNLHISYSDDLLCPTVGGITWGGNSVYLVKREGLSPATVGTGHASATALERAAIERETASLALAFGYEVNRPTQTRASLLRRGPKEKMRQYILNRVEAAHSRWHLAGPSNDTPA